MVVVFMLAISTSVDGRDESLEGIVRRWVERTDYRTPAAVGPEAETKVDGRIC